MAKGDWKLGMTDQQSDETASLLHESAGRLFGSVDEKDIRAVEQGEWPDAVWAKVQDAGFPLALVSEAARNQAFRTPLLIAAGDSDRVTCTRSAAAFCKRSDQAELLLLNDCAHEVLLERDNIRDRFWSAFDLFMRF